MSRILPSPVQIWSRRQFGLVKTLIADPINAKHFDDKVLRLNLEPAKDNSKKRSRPGPRRSEMEAELPEEDFVDTSPAKSRRANEEEEDD